MRALHLPPSSPRDYVAYGLRFRSEIALPVSPCTGQGEADVVVGLGAAPEAGALDGQRRNWNSEDGLFLLNVEGVARCVVRDGREIVIEPAGGTGATVGASTVGASMLSSALAACLQQRGTLTLHASAIATGAGAVLFAGSSGCGKSTLAAALVERGYALLADDMTGVVLDAGGRPAALPAFPCLRLRADAVDKLAWQARTRGKIRDDLDKHLAPVGSFHAAPLPVRATTHLAMLCRHTYRRRYLRGSEARREHFRTAVALARFAPLACVTRPFHPFRLDALADEIERRLQVDRPAGADGPPVTADAAAARNTDPGRERLRDEVS